MSSCFAQIGSGNDAYVRMSVLDSGSEQHRGTEHEQRTFTSFGAGSSAAWRQTFAFEARPAGRSRKPRLGLRKARAQTLLVQNRITLVSTTWVLLRAAWEARQEEKRFEIVFAV